MADYEWLPYALLAAGAVATALIVLYATTHKQEKESPVTPREVQPVREIIREKEIIKEIVMIPCQHCGGLMPQTSVFCPNCGARRKS